MGGAESKPRAKHARFSSHLVDRPTPPGKPQLVPSDQHSPEPDVVTIRWEPPLSDGGTRITGYLVEHRRTGSPHWVRSSPTLVRVPELTLSGLEPGWRYQFRVSAQNVVGLSDPGELSDLLTVTLQRTAASAPYFIRELKDTAAIENEKAELTVQVRGTPTPTISWFKDGVEIFSSRSYRVILDNETSTLIIHQASLSDEGEIKCSATNRVGYTVTRAKLVIEAPPSIRLPRQYEEGLLFEKDEVIRLKVSVAGRPVPEVSWSLNGEPVPGGGRYEASHSERYATLRVGEARRTDRGEYQVRAVNRLGEDVASFLVTVADRPMPPGKAKVVMTLGRSVTLSWTTPEDDGGCKIGNYIVEYYRLGWNMWLKAATCRQLTTTLGDLIEGSEYKFRVKAENPYGVSEPSLESDVVFIPDPKRGLLEPPEHGRADLETMDIWQEEKKRPISPSVNIDDQYGERKTKKKRGPMLPSQTELEKLDKLEKHSMMSEDSMSPPATPENYLPVIPKRRGKLEREDRIIEDEIKVEKELARKLEERRKVEEFKKFEEFKKAEELKKAEEMKKLEEAQPKEGRRLAELRRRRQLQMTPESSREEHDPLHGSSEFMLVLVPQSRATTEEREASKRELFESSIALEGDVAPPMSLSAPELGSDGPPELPPVRAAFSSTELLHERAMARFYQEAQEEAEPSNQRRNSLQRRQSFERKSLPKIEPVSEVTGSLQDMTSILSSQKEEKNISERPSLVLENKSKVEVVRGILTSKVDQGSTPSKVQYDRKTFSRDSMDSMLSTEDPHRKILVQQTSEEDMEYEDSSFDEDEYDEEEEEPITESIIDEDIDEELEDEEDTSGYERKSSIYTSESEEEAQYSYSLEEDTYHPTAVNIKYNEDTMISAYEGRGPLILGTVGAKTLSSTAAEEVEDLSKDNGVKPKSILKHPKVEINTQDYSDNNQTNDQPTKRLASPEKRYEPNFSPIMPKPILKVRELSQERQASPNRRGSGAPVAEVEVELNIPSSRTNLDELSDYETGTKKKVRIETPEELALKEKEIELSKEKSDLKKEDVEATKVLISHYSDIVAEYSKNKRPRKRLYLDYEALKAAAEKEDEGAPEILETKVDEATVESESKPNFEDPKIEVKEQTLITQEESQEPEKLIVHFQDKVEEFKETCEESIQLTKEKSPSPQKKLPPSILKRRTSSPMTKRSPSPRVLMRCQTLPEVVKEFIPVQTKTLEPEEIARTPSPILPPRPLTPTERKVHTYCDFLMDLSLFLLACWLYLFKDERLSIPVMCLMIYRQAHEAFQRKMEAARESYHRKMEAIRNKIPFIKKE